jgi:alkylation response protein AidB-like acyl-CoA dehydrogenase
MRSPTRGRMHPRARPDTIHAMSTAHTRACSLLETARELAPAIRRAANEIEQTRELPRPLFETMADAGLFHMLVPHQLGGSELDLPTYIQVIEEIGKADASTAWCVNQGGVYATHSVCVPPALAREIWIDTPRGVVANTPAPTATAVPVDGGYLVTGCQGFSTGSRHASWIAARGRIIENGQPRRQADGELDIRFFMMPVGEVELLDTWHTRGLRGTGTHHFTVTDHFVPEARTFSAAAPPRPEYGPLYAVPRTLMFATGDAATALGLARSSLDAFVELANAKTPGSMSDLLRDQALVQYEIGQAEALHRAARALLFETVCEIWEPISSTGVMTLAQRAALRTATTFALRQSASVVDTTYNLAGATAVLESHVLQRYFQDAHVITQHVQSRLNHYQLLGRYYLGLEPDDQYL